MNRRGEEHRVLDWLVERERLEWVVEGARKYSYVTVKACQWIEKPLKNRLIFIKIRETGCFTGFLKTARSNLKYLKL
jgi:hypothetical protein